MPEWQPGHLLVTDGCQDSIRDFWSRSGLPPAQKMYEDPTANRCCVCARTFKRPQDLKAHCTRERHHLDKLQSAVSAKAVHAAKLTKRKQMQHMLPKVQWGDIQIDNCWHFKYLGSQFEAGGGQLYDVRKRVAMTKQRHGKNATYMGVE